MKKLNFLLLFWFCFCLVSFTMAQDPITDSPVTMIIDTDMAVDDWLAILYLTQRPDVHVLALSITGTGEAHCEPGIPNALRLLKLAGQESVPVACGRETPLEGSNAFPDWLRESVDSMSGITLPESEASPYEGSAVDLLLETLHGAENPVRILTLGPLTNIAELLQAEPGIIDKIEMIYVMGGAVDVPGNTGFINPINRFAEANIYVDPHATAIMFASGVPITLIPLDATNDAPVTEAFVERLEEDRTTPQADFVWQVLANSLDFIRQGGYFFWDPLAAAVSLDESLVSIEERRLSVVEERGAHNGQTVADEAGALIRVAVSADAERFEQLFVDVLNGRITTESAS